MKPEQAAHSYEGRLFSEQELRYLKGSFKLSYQSSIQKHGNREFIQCYERQNLISKTFNEFDRDVQLACQVITRSLQPVQKVFVALVTNSYLSLVFMTAALLRGLTVCPINPAEGFERITAKTNQIMEPFSVWSHQDLKGVDWPFEIRQMEIIPQTESLNSFVEFPLGRPMILIFTSGSTGYSKIVEQMESNILSNVDSLIEHHRLHEKKTIGTSLPVFHVNALEFSFFGTLLSGSKIVLYEQFDLFTVLHSLEKDKVQILSVVPTLLQLILKRKKDFLAVNLNEFQYFISAASALPRAIALEIIESFQRPLIQGYGLSEAVNFSATMPIDLKKEDYQYWLTHFPHPSIGKALRGNEIHILNSQGSACNEGEIGEICIRGFNVMKSYRGVKPEELFKEGVLKTGDLGYFQRDPNGEKFYFVSGRVKDVIKKNGETVSLREIDDLLAPFLGAGHDAIAVGFENESSGEDIGIIVKSERPEEARASILEFLQKTFIDQMRPKVVLFTTDEIRTPSGKPQRWKFKERFLPYKARTFSAKSVIES